MRKEAAPYAADSAPAIPESLKTPDVVSTPRFSHKILRFPIVWISERVCETVFRFPFRPLWIISAPMSESASSWQIPNRRDPRWIFAALLGCYAVAGGVWLDFNRDPFQVALTILACAGLDMAFAWMFRKQKLVPLSACITGLGLSLLVNYPHDRWLLFLPAFFAISSKYLITRGGKHIYNPALFGVMAALWFGGGRFTTTPPYQWGADPMVAGGFLAVAAVACFACNIRRGPLIISFLLSFTALTCLRAYVMRWHLPPETLITGTLVSPAFFLFAFYMITDPKTSPSSARGQIAWGISVAVLDLVLHFRSSLSTIFTALFIFSTVKFLWESLPGNAGAFRPKVAWLQRAAIVALVGLAGTAAYARLARSFYRTPVANFTLTRVPMENAPLSDVMEKVDPRIAHIAKWVLSVGDAVAIGDYDGDGLQDIFLTYPLKSSEHRNSLYRNLGNMKFERVVIPALDEISAHPEIHGLIAGALFADYDNSGRQSLLLMCGWGKTRLLKNTVDAAGNVVFTDVTRQSGIDETTVSVAATFADFDRDGDLDLLIGNAMSPFLPDYAKPTPFNIFSLPPAEYEGDRRMFHFMHHTWHNAENGGPFVYYQNDGSGYFVKQDAAAMGMPETHWTMAIGTTDFNHDDWPDLYCASDYGPDDVYINERGSHFRRIAGSFHGSVGRDSYKGMNVSIGDLDNSGGTDIYVSNVHAPLQAEGSLCWRVDGENFDDLAARRLLVNESRFGWGAAMGDLNLDGSLDIMQANGMVDDTADKRFPEKRDYWYRASQVMRAGPDVHSYADRWADLRGYDIWGHQRNRVYLSDGGAPARFLDVAEQVGVTNLTNSRAIAFADFDNDGDLDVVVTHQFADAEILKNNYRETRGGHWLGFELAGDGAKVNRDAVGARVSVTAAGKTMTREVSMTSGFSAQSDRRLHFGLGNHAGPVSAVILWPDGTEQKLSDCEPGKYHRMNYPIPPHVTRR